MNIVGPNAHFKDKKRPLPPGMDGEGSVQVKHGYWQCQGLCYLWQGRDW